MPGVKRVHKRRYQGDGMLTKTITLNDAQIKALPTKWKTSAALAIIAPTETLNYNAASTKLFVPISAYVVFNNIAGAYTNTRVDGKIIQLRLVWGRDWSYTVGFILQRILPDVTTGIAVVTEFSFSVGTIVNPPAWTPFLCTPPIDGSSTGLADNGLYIVSDNGAAGDFTGGHVNNTLKVVVNYNVINV